MATAMNISILEPSLRGPGDALTKELRARQQRIAEITEMIHVSSLEFYGSFFMLFCSAIFCNPDSSFNYLSLHGLIRALVPVILKF